MHDPKKYSREHGPRCGGFTLTEILIALGLLGVGLAMIAALLVTGISVIDTKMRAQVIAANGLATACRKIRAGNVTNETLTPIAYTLRATPAEGTGIISKLEQMSPHGDAGSRDGFIVLARTFNGDADPDTEEGHQIVVVAYHKTDSTDVRIEQIIGSASGTILTATANGDKMRVGSPVIVAATGQYATIISISENTAGLDHPIETLEGGGLAWVVYQEDSLPTDSSPATAVLVGRAQLQP